MFIYAISAIRRSVLSITWKHCPSGSGCRVTTIFWRWSGASRRSSMLGALAGFPPAAVFRQTCWLHVMGSVGCTCWRWVAPSPRRRLTFSLAPGHPLRAHVALLFLGMGGLFVHGYLVLCASCRDGGASSTGTYRPRSLLLIAAGRRRPRDCPLDGLPVAPWRPPGDGVTGRSGKITALKTEKSGGISRP